MTAFMKEQAERHNPNYEEASTLKNFVVFMIAALPFFLGMIYFASKSGMFLLG